MTTVSSMYTRISVRNTKCSLLSTNWIFNIFLSKLDLSWCGNYGRIQPHVLRTFLYSRGSNLNHLVLANCHVATYSVLHIVASTCKNLIELNLSNCHILESGSFSGTWFFECNQRRCKFARKIKTKLFILICFSISFPELRNLKSLQYLNLYRTQIAQSELKTILSVNPK